MAQYEVRWVEWVYASLVVEAEDEDGAWAEVMADGDGAKIRDNGFDDITITRLEEAKA